MDRSLKSHGRLARSRSVLSRSERVARLIDEGKFDLAKDSPYGLPKVRVRHSKAGTKTKKAAEAVLGAEGAPVEGAAAAAPAGEAVKGAAPKGAAPKGAAPKGAAKPAAAKPAATSKGDDKRK